MYRTKRKRVLWRWCKLKRDFDAMGNAACNVKCNHYFPVYDPMSLLLLQILVLANKCFRLKGIVLRTHICIQIIHEPHAIHYSSVRFRDSCTLFIVATDRCKLRLGPMQTFAFEWLQILSTWFLCTFSNHILAPLISIATNKASIASGPVLSDHF